MKSLKIMCIQPCRFLGKHKTRVCCSKRILITFKPAKLFKTSFQIDGDICWFLTSPSEFTALFRNNHRAPLKGVVVLYGREGWRGVVGDGRVSLVNRPPFRMFSVLVLWVLNAKPHLNATVAGLLNIMRWFICFPLWRSSQYKAVLFP